MALPPEHAQTILDLEARHDELLELLAELEQRVASVLAQYQVGRPGAGPGPSAQAASSTPEPIRAAAA